jgi:hypothetical protein
MGRLYDFCAYRAELMGRNPPRGEAEAAQARAELRAISELERFARAVRVVCCDAPVEVEVRGGPK